MCDGAMLYLLLYVYVYVKQHKFTHIKFVIELVFSLSATRMKIR